ncbi:MAG: DUF3352 domain-containing protein, partial [Chloroflexota bacterium]|nr:DUF3352 domain-containing protein [Chloroflexota bacterium]
SRGEVPADPAAREAPAWPAQDRLQRPPPEQADAAASTGSGNEPGPEWAPTTTYSASPGVPWAARRADAEILAADDGSVGPGAAPATTPVARRPGPGRWVVALLATAFVVAAAAALVFLAGGPTPSGAPAYLPANTLLYTEARLDLPGDQRQKAAEFLSHFPGFDDKAALERKVDDTLDRFFREATDARYTYTGDLKPWFGGQVSFAVLDLPAPGARTSDAPVLALVSVSDRSKAQSALDKLRGEAQGKASFRSEEYKGTTIWTAEASTAAPQGVPRRLEYALTNDMLLVSFQPGAVKAALDRKGGAGDVLGRSRAYTEGTRGLRDDRLGAFYLGTDALKSALEKQVSAGAGGSEPLRQALRSLPERLAGWARIEPDRIIVDTRSDLPQGAPRPNPHESTLASRVPASSVVFVETPDVGQGIGRFIAQLKADPSFRDAAPQLEQVEMVLGNKLESYFDWLGDVAIVAEVKDKVPSGGLVGTVANEDAARRRLGQLAELVRLAGAQTGGQVAVRSEQRSGTTVTTIAIATPPTTEPLGRDVEVSYAFKGGLFVLGLRDYVGRVLDLPPAETLAQSARFRDAVAAAGGPRTAGVTYVDLAALRSAIEGQLAPDDRTRYEQEYRPYLEPLDRLVSATVADGNSFVSRSIFILK